MKESNASLNSIPLMSKPRMKICNDQAELGLVLASIFQLEQF